MSRTSRALLILILSTLPARAEEARCWLRCAPPRVESAQILLTRDVPEDRWLRLCLDRKLNKREYYYPSVTLIGRSGVRMSIEFVLSIYFNDEEIDDGNCYLRNLARHLPYNVNNYTLERWNTYVTPEKLQQLHIKMRSKHWLTGSLQGYQDYHARRVWE